MKQEPQKQHQWLQKLVGDWTYESEASASPDAPPTKYTGTETVRSLGGMWVIAEGQGEMPGGGQATAIMTLGYDSHRKRYVGTFIGSMMDFLWLYEDGSLDTDRNVLALVADGPDMVTQEKLMKYRDAIEFKSDDHRVLTASLMGEDGQWNSFMTVNYWRKK